MYTVAARRVSKVAITDSYHHHPTTRPLSYIIIQPQSIFINTDSSTSFFPSYLSRTHSHRAEVYRTAIIRAVRYICGRERERLLFVLHNAAPDVGKLHGGPTSRPADMRVELSSFVFDKCSAHCTAAARKLTSICYPIRRRCCCCCCIYLYNGNESLLGEAGYYRVENSQMPASV